MTDEELFKRHETTVDGIDGPVIDYDTFDDIHLEGLDGVDLQSLTGRSLGHYYVKRLIRYLKSVDRLPADHNGALLMTGLSQGAGIPYQNMFRPGKLKNLIELARRRKGLRRWADTIDPKDLYDSAEAEKDRQIFELKQRLASKDAEVRAVQTVLKAEQDAHRETRRVLEARIRELEDQREGAIDEIFTGHMAR